MIDKVFLLIIFFLTATTFTEREREQDVLLPANRNPGALSRNFDNNLIVNVMKDGSVHLLGERQDIPRLLASLDIASCSSKVEAFPNAVAEAMASGIACVSTNVGDASWIIGNTGRLVPPRNPWALAEAWGEILKLPQEKRTHLGTLARHRIKENFSIPKMVTAYETLYEDINKPSKIR